MNVISTLDFISAVGFVIAFFLTLRSRMALFPKRILLMSIGLYFFVGISNTLQHTGITEALDFYEDYAELLFPPLFLAFIHASTMVREIRQRELIESALRESEERYRLLFNSGNDAIMVHSMDPDGRKMRFVEVNEVTCKRLGYTREEFLRLSPLDIDKPESTGDTAEVIETLQRVHRVLFERVHLSRDGREIPVEINAHLFTFDGRPAVLSVARDITERKMAERDLKQAYAEMARQNEELKKLDRIKDELIRNVTHELKTPVAKHSMYLEMLRKNLFGPQLDGTIKNILRVMEESVARQNRVIRNLLELARLESGQRPYQKEFFRLDTLLEQVIEDYQHAVSIHGIKLESHLEPVKIKSNSELLWHVFSNFINNAIKFRATKGKPFIKVFVEKPDNQALVRVVDNGVGMTPEQLDRAFEEFYQASTSTEGCGVGLTISKMIVESLGGTIKIESAIDSGTTIIASFPRE